MQPTDGETVCCNIAVHGNNEGKGKCDYGLVDGAYFKCSYGTAQRQYRTQRALVLLASIVCQPIIALILTIVVYDHVVLF